MDVARKLKELEQRSQAVGVPVTVQRRQRSEPSEQMIGTLQRISGYATYFEEAFGTPEITGDRVAKAIADYERTRMSGNSPYDRWKAGDESAVSDQVKLGDELCLR